MRVKSVAMAQYESLHSTLDKTMKRSGWVVYQRRVIEGARSLNVTELKENLEYFKVPSVSIEPIVIYILLMQMEIFVFGTLIPLI